MGDFKILLKQVDPDHVENLRPILADLFSVDEGTAHDILSAIPLTLVDGLSIRGATIVKDRLKRLTLLGATLVTTDDLCEDLPKINWPEPPEVAEVAELDSPASSTFTQTLPAVSCPSCGEHLEVVLVPRGKKGDGAAPPAAAAPAAPRAAPPPPAPDLEPEPEPEHEPEPALELEPELSETPTEPSTTYSPVAPAPREENLDAVFDSILDSGETPARSSSSGIAPGPIARLHQESGRLKAERYHEPERFHEPVHHAEPLLHDEPEHAEPVFGEMLDTSTLQDGTLNSPFREPDSDPMLEAVFDDSDSLEPVEPVFEHDAVDALSEPEIDAMLDDEDSFDLNALDDILDAGPNEIEGIETVDVVDESDDDLIDDPDIFQDDSSTIDLDSLDRELAALDQVKAESPPRVEPVEPPPLKKKKKRSKRKRKGRKGELQPLDPSEALAILHSSRQSLDPIPREPDPTDELDDLLAQAQKQRKKRSRKVDELSLPTPPEKRKHNSPVFKKVDKVTRRIKSTRMKKSRKDTVVATDPPPAPTSKPRKRAGGGGGGEKIHGLVLSKISSDVKKKKAAALIASIKEISEDEAMKLTDRTIIPVLRGVSRDYAEECLGRFRVANISGRVTTRRS